MNCHIHRLYQWVDIKRNKEIKKITKRCNGPAGSVFFRSSALLPKSQVYQRLVLQIPLAPERKRLYV